MNRSRTTFTLIAWMAVCSFSVPGTLTGQACASEDQVGSLGITGIRCERCSFYTNGEAHSAVFFTEPIIQSLNPSLPASTVLESGDVIVAIDGALITTTAGSELFSALPNEEFVNVTVRREGRLRDLIVPLAPTCRAPDEALVSSGGESRAAPRRFAWSPSAVRLDQELDGVALGFQLACVECRRDESGTWVFDEHPQVGSIAVGTLAWQEWRMPSGAFIRALDGLSLTSPQGGHRFSNISPGDELVWTIFQYGRERTVRTRALLPEEEGAAVAQPLTGDPVSDSMRLVYTGPVGPALVEMRARHGTPGGFVIREGRDDNEFIIRFVDREIRIRVPPGDARRR